MAIGPSAIRPHRPPVPWTPVAVTEERCKGCELCVGACPRGCLALDLSRVNVLGYHPVRLTDASACTSCAICARVCPDYVFTIWSARKGVAG